MRPACDLGVWIRELGRVAHDVHGHSADGREEDFDVGSGEQFGVHSTSVLEQGSSEGGFLDFEAFGHTGEIPYGIDGGLECIDLDALVDAGEGGEMG